MAFGRREQLDPSMSRDDLAAFVVAARAVNQPTDLDTTLETILAQALALVGADEGSVMLVSPDGQSLRIAAARGLRPEVAQEVRVELGVGISGYVAASGQELLLDSAEAVDRYAEERRRGLRSAVCVPLKSDGRVLGVLNLNVIRGSSAQDLGPQELGLAALFAEFAAAAVRNATLVQASRDRSARLAQLLEASHALSDTLELDAVAQRVIATGREMLGGTAGILFVAGDRGVDIAATDALPRGLARATLQRGGLEDLLQQRGVEVVPDLAEHPVLAPLARRGPMAVVAGLHGGSQDRGLVVVLVDELPSAPSIETWTSYVHHAAFAVARATLFRDVRAKEQELTSLTTAVPDPVVVIDGRDRLAAINPAAAEVFNLSPSFDIGQPFYGRLREPAIEALLATSEGGAVDTTISGGGPTVYRARVVPVRAGAATPGGRILSLEDVTAAREIERTKADFVAVVGHELRTPLTMIKGYSATLSQRADQLSPAARTKAFEALHAQTLKLERLIEDLLLVSTVERDRPPLHVAPHDLDDVVRRAVAEAVDGHGAHRFELSLPPTPATVEIDAVKLQQVLHHLIDNACKFSEPGSTVRIDGELEPGAIVLRVTDEGVGIFSGDVPTLFDRFRQVDGTATRQHGGTGVGLHICKTLVEAHGGGIDIRSALGRGTTVTIRLPHGPALAPVVSEAG